MGAQGLGAVWSGGAVGMGEGMVGACQHWRKLPQCGGLPLQQRRGQGSGETPQDWGSGVGGTGGCGLGWGMEGCRSGTRGTSRDEGEAAGWE